MIARLREMTGTEVEVLPGVTENVRFRMPPQLVDSPSRAGGIARTTAGSASRS